jgi:hypothetical protein
VTVNGNLVQAFQAASLASLPDIGVISDERLQALWTLHVGQERASVEMMTPSEISLVLRDAFGVALSRQRIEAILSNEKQAVAKRRKNGKRAYQVMKAGISEVEGVSAQVVLIEPERALSSLRATEGLLHSLAGDLKICDPYVDGRTLDLLGECSNADSVQLLTANVKKETTFKRDAKAFGKEHGSALEVRVAPSGVLHDRYVIHVAGMLLFGTSLNGIGFKQSFVVALGEDIRASVLMSFDSYWRTATPL